MSNFTYQTPDLASVLKTLAAFAPPQPRPAAQSLSAQHTAPADPPIPSQKDYEPEEGEYEPPDSISQVQASPRTAPVNIPGDGSTAQVQSSRDPRLHPASAMHQQAPAGLVNRPPTIDATTITDWSAGLRCVMKTVAQNDATMARIKKLIKVQHDNENSWWEGREALLKKQEARVEGKKKLDEVLRSVGGIVPAGTAVSTPEQDAQELRTYEKKVYKASVDMAKAMGSDLKNLGVPFFGTRPSLVWKRGSGPPIADSLGGSDGPTDGDGKISEQELVKLQKRMLELLEDMCK